MLNKELLKFKLECFIDQESSNFQRFPKSIEESAELFGDSLDSYIKNIIPVSNNQAKGDFINIFRLMSNESNNGEELLVEALNAFALSVGVGMINGTILSSNPPRFVKEDFSAIWQSGFKGSSSTNCIMQFSSIIDAKMKMGYSINSIGSIIPWI